ncbi:toprim domain-containing protein [Arsenicibacter rosenii]|uniref:Toprim domain-containing protein n=1 Tax=Arsenicibacter rosenii TaxID=1750698 RepID=A0A1S2VLX0_9BACT|nr:toprim domain-containing protein [Arsenicibacter rosenii]OIN59777.1 hypothetical protein BLX24_07935 [Arsenicibacter rosenii]
MNPQTTNPAVSGTYSYDDYYTINQKVAEKYHRTLLEEKSAPVRAYLYSRGLTDDAIRHWQIGYAPRDWRHLTTSLIENAIFEPAAELGVVVSENGRNRDFFYDRIIFPIRDEQSRVTGFTGRTVGKPADGQPKYLNIRNTVLFEKSEAMYGIHRAIREMKRTKKAVLVEGQPDVISLHRAGLENAVAKSGTALTQKQTELLLRHCDVVTLIYDNDTAGQKALESNLESLLLSGLRVKIYRLADGFHDADDWLTWVSKVFGAPLEDCQRPLGIARYVEQESEDGFLSLAEKLLSTDLIDERVEGSRRIVEMLASMRDGHWAQEYLSELCKRRKYGLNQKDIWKQVQERKNPAKEVRDDDGDDHWELPEWVEAREVREWGFAERLKGDKQWPTGYYFGTLSGSLDRMPVTNFVLTPLYHIKDRGNVRRLVEMTNGHKRVYVEINSKVLNSVQSFEEEVSNFGHFMTDAKFKRDHLKRIANKIMALTPEVFPIKTLGWQPEGFFAWSNAVYNGHLEHYDEHGIVKMENGDHFFSPALSPIFANFRQEDDAYQFDKYLSFQPSPVAFGEWAALLKKVYGERAIIGSVFAVTALFRDVVLKSSKIPIIYCYGPRDSGKSTFAESIMYLVFGGLDASGKLIKPLNFTSSPTKAAFWTAMSRYRNCPYVFNEFDDQRVEDWAFDAFKSAWDNEGRLRQKKDDSQSSEMQNVNCAPMIVGQYLSTRDDGSVTSRSLIFEFVNRKDDPFTDEEIRNYDRLRDLQQSNLSGILTEILPFRKKMETEYQTVVRKIKEQLRERLEQLEVKQYQSRTFENVTCLLAVYETLKEDLVWPFEAPEIWEYCIQMIKQMSALLTETDALSSFWSMLEYLLDRAEITGGWDFRIDTVTSVKLHGGDKKAYEKSFDKPKRLLYLRVKNVWKPYAENARRQGETPMKEQTLTVYLRQQAYYIGWNNSIWFKRGTEGTNSSALVFDYDMLAERSGISLERAPEESPDSRAVMSFSGVLVKTIEKVPAGSGIMIIFWLQVTMIKNHESEIFDTDQYAIKCYSPDLAHAGLQPGGRYQVSGAYSEQPYQNAAGKGVLRKLDVTEVTELNTIAYEQGFEQRDPVF